MLKSVYFVSFNSICGRNIKKNIGQLFRCSKKTDFLNVFVDTATLKTIYLLDGSYIILKDDYTAICLAIIPSSPAGL